MNKSYELLTTIFRDPLYHSEFLKIILKTIWVIRITTTLSIMASMKEPLRKPILILNLTIQVIVS